MPDPIDSNHPVNTSATETEASAPGTRASEPVRPTIENRLRFKPVEDEGGKAHLNHMLRIAREQSCEEAIRQSMDAKQAFYALDDSRLKILDLLELTSEMDVLEIGSSLGQMTPTLASRSRSVQALEVVPEQAEFTDERCRQAGHDNVTVIMGGDDCTLPYPDDSFDAVVMNLVFEWCANRMQGMSRDDAQRQMLGEIARVMRPGGQLLLNTKNRYALQLLMGGRDGHAHNIRFGYALPRWLMNLALRRAGKPVPPWGLLHSYRALNRMIRRAGFGELRTYWLAPEMRYPTHVVSTDSAAIRRQRRDPEFAAKQGEIRRTRLAMRWIPARLIRYFTPGLCTVARRTD